MPPVGSVIQDPILILNVLKHWVKGVSIATHHGTSSWDISTRKRTLKVCSINNIIEINSTIRDSWIFYEKTTTHLDNGAPVEKAPTPNQFSTKQKVLYSKSMHNTQNQPSQPVMYSLFDHSRPLITKLPDMQTFHLKLGRLTCFAFFAFLISSV